MVKYFCDRCQQQSISQSNLRQVTVPAIQQGATVIAVLCRDCMDGLKRWIAEPPAQAPPRVTIRTEPVDSGTL
jgi:hypothetical protein